MRRPPIPLASIHGSEEASAAARSGEVANVAFADLCQLVETFGFELRRTRGSHHVFVHPEVRELLTLQEVGGQAKPYQIRQFLRLVERYALRMEERR
jgi:predicted RNA binding protein YcfA (HicA-like mRNA interferase family)